MEASQWAKVGLDNRGAGKSTGRQNRDMVRNRAARTSGVLRVVGYHADGSTPFAHLPINEHFAWKRVNGQSNRGAGKSTGRQNRHIVRNRAARTSGVLRSVVPQPDMPVFARDRGQMQTRRRRSLCFLSRMAVVRDRMLCGRWPLRPRREV